MSLTPHFHLLRAQIDISSALSPIPLNSAQTERTERYKQERRAAAFALLVTKRKPRMQSQCHKRVGAVLRRWTRQAMS